MDKASPGITVVVATRLSKEDFLERSLLGKTLVRRASVTRVHLFPDNKRGLSEIYNEAARLNEAGPDQILMFLHDDVMLVDLFWEERVISALQTFDVLGVAGTTVRHPYQPSWIFKSLNLTTDQLTRENLALLSGTVGHGDCFPPRNVSRYGPVPREVKLLDGLMLCMRASLFPQTLQFDERFDFHFYDMDICRQAEAKGLKCGTVDISLVHKSGGNFGSEAWRAGYAKYIEKWGS